MQLAKQKQPQTLGAKIDAAYELREEIRALTQEQNQLKDQLKDLESEIMAALSEQDTIQSAGRVAKVTITETVVPQVTDWDEFYAYIKENDAFYMLNRAPNAASFRETLTIEGSVPGVEPFTKRALSLRKS